MLEFETVPLFFGRTGRAKLRRATGADVTTGDWATGIAAAVTAALGAVLVVPDCLSELAGALRSSGGLVTCSRLGEGTTVALSLAPFINDPATLLGNVDVNLLRFAIAVAKAIAAKAHPTMSAHLAFRKER